MASVSFTASVRTTTGKGVARKLRAAGEVPAVIYGHGREPQSLTLNAHEFQLLLEKYPYRSTVVDLAIDGKSKRTLIREVQRHPFKKIILHVDFQELVAGEKITVKVPLHYHGTPEGVRVSGGVLDQVMHELEITTDPGNIPSQLEVDVSSLTVGHSIHAGDVPLPAGVELLTDPGATVCVCAAPRVDTSAAAAAAAAGEAGASEPEVIRKGKDEEEAETK